MISSDFGVVPQVGTGINVGYHGASSTQSVVCAASLTEKGRVVVSTWKTPRWVLQAVGNSGKEQGSGCGVCKFLSFRLSWKLP